MAKKDKKKSAKKDERGAAEAIRAAVEQAVAATSGGAQELVEDVASMAARVRGSLEDLRVLEDLRGLRTELDALSRRVAALEAAAAAGNGAKPEPKAKAARASAGTKPAGTRSPRAKGAAKPKAAATETADTASAGRS